MPFLCAGHITGFSGLKGFTYKPDLLLKGKKVCHELIFGNSLKGANNYFTNCRVDGQCVCEYLAHPAH